MSEAFEAKIVGLAAAIFLTVVTIWVLYSHYFLSLFETALAAASALIVAAS
jgi:heme/copper-type cytochrome/quinol oxidase subunit 4